MPALCQFCHENERMFAQSRCRQCFAEYMRWWRWWTFAYRRESLETRRRRKCRAAARYAKKKGIIVPTPLCQECNKVPPEEMHHEDYDKPLEVTWLCRACHVAETWD